MGYGLCAQYCVVPHTVLYCTIHSTSQYTRYSTQCIVQHTMCCTLHCVLYIVPYPLQNTVCTVYSILFTAYSVRYIPCTSKPSTPYEKFVCCAQYFIGQHRVLLKCDRGWLSKLISSINTSPFII